MSPPLLIASTISEEGLADPTLPADVIFECRMRARSVDVDSGPDRKGYPTSASSGDFPGLDSFAPDLPSSSRFKSSQSG